MFCSQTSIRRLSIHVANAWLLQAAGTKKIKGNDGAKPKTKVVATKKK